MVKNYFVAAWRNLIRNKVYSLINLAGLSLGLACVLLIVLYVKDEVSYDRFHKNADRLYRVVVGSRDPRAIGRPKMGITGFLQGPKFAAKLPGIEAFVRVVGSQMDLQTAGGVKSQALLYADSNFFSVFSFPLLSGDPRTALLQPHAVVVSEDAARKEFGTMDAVGKTLFGKDGNRFTAFTVTGVARRCPQNSSIKFEMLMPLKIAKDEENKISNWQSFFLSTYVVLKPAADRQAVEAGMLRVYREDAAPLIRAMESHDKTEDMGYFELQPFTAMHLGKDTSQENLSDASNPIFSYILSGIAVLFC